jgi:hypothetical protein
MSIPLVVDGVTDADSAIMNQIINAANGKAVGGLFNVVAYGAEGDGVTDDTEAIQDAIDAAGAAGGGTIHFPAGRYLVTRQGTAGGHGWCLSVVGDNLTFSGLGDSSVIVADLSASSSYTGIFYIQGGGKPQGIALWGSYYWPYESPYSGPTRYTINAAARNATAITTTTAADAGNFSAGDWCFIFTGQTNEFDPPMQPDSEINQVIAVNAGTGVLTLRWPLSKPYEAEAVDTGGGYTYQSIVGGAGAALAIGVQNVTTSIVSNLLFRDVFIESLDAPAGGQSAFLMNQAFGATIERVNGDMVGSFVSSTPARNVRVRDCMTRHRNTASEYHVAPSLGCTDWLVTGCNASSSHNIFFHAHEGTAQIKFIGNTINNTYVAADLNTVSIRARAYDVQIIGNSLINGGTGGLIYVDELCTGGGAIVGNSLQSQGTVNVDMRADNWTVLANYGNLGYGVNLRGTNFAGGTQAASAWVFDDRQSVDIVSLTGAFVIHRVSVYVLEAFNSDGSDLIDVGWSGNAETLTADVDVSTTGAKTVTPGAGVGYPWHESVTIQAIYSNGGTEPTAGQALVTVEYSIIERVD